MARRRTLEVTGLPEWIRGLSRMDGSEAANTKSRILRSSGMRGLEALDDLTPVKSGRLKDSMSYGDRDNVFKLQVGRSAFVFVGTAVSYAQHVNDGFTQKAGQYVPGFWRGDTFHYDPDSDEGMVLTGKVIPGAHMFERAIDELEADLPRIVDYEFRRLYQRLF